MSKRLYVFLLFYLAACAIVLFGLMIAQQWQMDRDEYQANCEEDTLETKTNEPNTVRLVFRGCSIFDNTYMIYLRRPNKSKEDLIVTSTSEIQGFVWHDKNHVEIQLIGDVINLRPQVDGINFEVKRLGESK